MNEWTDPLSDKPLPWQYGKDQTAQRADAMFELVYSGNGSVLGYKYEDVARQFGQNFRDWLTGQTVALGPNGETVVYRHDVWQYMDGGGPLD